MNKEIRLNAFTMNTVGHISPGLWTHPRDRSHLYTDLQHWADLAKTLERGRFDALFIADVIGIYDVYHGDRTYPIRHATQVPVNDPLLIVPAMALVTEHLSFGVTSSVSYEHPYTFARRFSTLDHLTKGRVAWNVVTSYLDSGARAAGRRSPPMMNATTSPKTISTSATSCGKEAGRTARSSATRRRASLPIRQRCTISAITARSSRSTAFTCPSHRRSARR